MKVADAVLGGNALDPDVVREDGKPCGHRLENLDLDAGAHAQRSNKAKRTGKIGLDRVNKTGEGHALAHTRG